MRAVLKTVLGGVIGAGALFAISGDEASAQCCAPPVPPCCTPPSPPTPPSGPCCAPPGHSVNVPGVNVFVGASVVVNANVNANVQAQAGAGARANAGGVVFFGGGGSVGGLMPQPVSVIQGLNVEGGKEMRRTAYEASRSKTTRVVIQAFCLDDKDVPHPASQLFPERDVENTFEGELYRCIAGARMQYVIADYFDKVSFDGGKTITCDKSQALYHTREGKLECRKQAPARDCNERSLLRRFGAGVKILVITTTETYTAYREEMVESASSSMSSMSLTGGVGGIAY